MSLKKDFYIDRISYQQAMDMVVKNHYLHRVAPCSYAFGLFRKSSNKINLFQTGDLIGCVVYGVSCSSTLLRGICGDEEKNNVYELTRLWIHDSSPKNAESFLIGNTIKKLDKQIIVSFAEINAGHTGVVYQASNFYYCGLSAKFVDVKVKGLEHQHHSTYANGMNKQQVIEKYGIDRVYTMERPRKHRYIFFNAKGKRKKQLLKKLNYQILPYPKL